MTVLVESLKSIVGDRGWTTDAADLEPHLTERRGRLKGRTAIMVSPSTTTQVADVVRTCASEGVSVVPQGGNTGLCGGAIPDDSGEQVLLSLSRMNQIRSIDKEDSSILVEAGCILADVQKAATESGQFFPLSLSAEGSCQIGGNLSTNAGGINVLRYGTARQQVLGLEVVLANGTVWDGLRTLRKDTAGFDLKQLFIGSEGTLGIITAATLRLWPHPGNTTTVLAALDAPGKAVELLAQLREEMGGNVQAFELMSDRCMRFVSRHIPDVRMPFDDDHPWFVLSEVDARGDPEGLENSLMRVFDGGLVEDVVIAKNQAESDELWRLRHSISEAQKPEGANLKHDISVPTGRIAEFLAEGDRLIRKMMPTARLVAFGHVGDGNLHYNVAQPVGGDGEAFLNEGLALTEAIYDLVASMKGSFSAEHGVGLFKKPYLERYRGGAEISLMRTIKSALDPENTLNPGKVI
jgi:FAD/FMN-containing dehydrogenase